MQIMGVFLIIPALNGQAKKVEWQLMVLGDEDRGALLLEINGDLIVKKGRPNGLFCVLEYPAKNIG